MTWLDTHIAETAIKQHEKETAARRARERRRRMLDDSIRTYGLFYKDPNGALIPVSGPDLTRTNKQ